MILKYTTVRQEARSVYTSGLKSTGLLGWWTYLQRLWVIHQLKLFLQSGLSRLRLTQQEKLQHPWINYATGPESRTDRYLDITLSFLKPLLFQLDVLVDLIGSLFGVGFFPEANISLFLGFKGWWPESKSEGVVLTMDWGSPNHDDGGRKETRIGFK
jgi:hypothetical protein